MKNNISDIRTAIFNRDNNTCYYCGAHGPNIELHLDHILPKSKYNLHSIYNLITSCKKCNFTKVDYYLSDKQYNRLFKYLQKANEIFSKKDIKIFSLCLTEYYKYKNKKKYNKNPTQYELCRAQIQANEKLLALRYLPVMA